MANEKIIIKTPQCEIEFTDLCNREYKLVCSLLYKIEEEFGTDMNKHQELRHEILDISNFIKRLPDMISEVV